jgi:hypothetical protein
MALPLIVDLVLAFTALEMLALLLWRRLTGRGLVVRQWLPMMAAGGCLMLALRLAVGGAALHWILLCLLGSAIAHATDLVRRWPVRSQPVETAAVPSTAPSMASSLTVTTRHPARP